MPLRAMTVASLNQLGLLSVSHRSTSLDILENLSLTREMATELCETLRMQGVEAVVLSTCNRTEVYWCGARDADVDLVRAAWARLGGRALHFHSDSAVHLRGEKVVRHLFRVAAGLESQLIGEAEVLGQVREALGQAPDTSGPLLSSLFRAALRAGGRARAETEIGVGALSIASAAIRLLVFDHPHMVHGLVLVVGAGAVGRAAARHLAAEGINRLVLVNRTPEHASLVAGELGAKVAPLEELSTWLREADAAIVATHAPSPLIKVDHARAAVQSRSGRPLVLFDLSLPRAVDSTVGKVDGVVVHDLSTLSELVGENHARREQEIPRVEAILERELGIFMARMRRHAVRPLIAELRRRTERLCRAELETALAGRGIDPSEVDRLARRLTDRLLSRSSQSIERGEVPLDAQHAGYLMRLFGLAEVDDA